MERWYFLSISKLKHNEVQVQQFLVNLYKKTLIFNVESQVIHNEISGVGFGVVKLNLKNYFLLSIQRPFCSAFGVFTKKTC